jgi:GntR family transcriptional regulator/MocR family aminotransferase
MLAIDQLMAEGYVVARAGAGTFVAPDLPDDLSRARPPRLLVPRHPPLSRRATLLADLRPRSWRLPGQPRAFRAGTPAVDLFPVRLWSRLTARRLRSASAGQFDYGEWPPLRHAIAGYLQRARATRCDAAQVVIVSGAQGGLDLLARLLLDPGDRVWMEEPGYVGAHGALVGAGACVVPVPVDADGLDVEAGVRRALGARLAYVTPSHQFPLGVVMSLPRRLALLKWASAAGAWVVEDDYDSEFRHGVRSVPCLHGMDTDGRVIYMGSFSKTLFPALRLGFLVVPPDLRDRFVTARLALELQPPPLDQAVLADFIAEGHYERHLRRMRAAYRERLEGLLAAATTYCGGALRVRPVLTGLHAIADLDGADDERVSREALSRGVEVMPMSLYFGRGPRPNALLLGFGPVRPDAAADGMRKLAAAIEAAAGSRRVSRRTLEVTCRSAGGN